MIQSRYARKNVGVYELPNQTLCHRPRRCNLSENSSNNDSPFCCAKVLLTLRGLIYFRAIMPPWTKAYRYYKVELCRLSAAFLRYGNASGKHQACQPIVNRQKNAVDSCLQKYAHRRQTSTWRYREKQPVRRTNKKLVYRDNAHISCRHNERSLTGLFLSTRICMHLFVLVLWICWMISIHCYRREVKIEPKPATTKIELLTTIIIANYTI